MKQRRNIRHRQQVMWKTISCIRNPFLMSPLLCLAILFHTASTLSLVSPTEFVYNTNFNSTNINLYGDATIESSILSLTNHSFFSLGRAFHPQKIPIKQANSSTLLSFATSFIFSIAPVKGLGTGHGFAFMFSPYKGINGTSPSEYLGLLNFSNQASPRNHVLGVEFDILRNEEFIDINDNHVGIDINSLTSSASYEAGYWDGEVDNEFKKLELKDGRNYQVWIEFMDSQLNITMAQAGRRKPQRPLISMTVNLSRVLLDEMYAGFSAATGKMIDSVRILAWSFSNSKFSIGDALVTNNLPSFEVQKGSLSVSLALVIGVSIVCILLICCGSVVFFILRRRKGKTEEEIEDWELEYWPHRISYPEIDAATRGFSEENVIGIGRNGKVYKGVLQGVEVAVKRIPQEASEGIREFLAEISSLGRMKHRNLVGLRGWCKKEKGSLILVYDYVENGSLDKRIFECEEKKMLSWEERVQVLKKVASGILYLHEGWEVKVLHRDIKASNVLLDKNMNARLGDFGLARMHDHHGQVANTTRVIGTVGYLAPEVVKVGRVSTLSDVFGFGILVLEVVCGRRPIEESKPGLIEWVLSLMKIGELHCALDQRLKAKGGYTIDEVEKLLYLGLLCANPDPNVRPTMRQIVKMMEEGIEGNDSDGDSMETSLLGKINSAAMWSGAATTSPFGVYPTIDEIMFSFNCNSVSDTISNSDIIPEVR